MYWIWTLFYVIFHLHAGKTEILMKRSNIVRKQARRRCWNKAGGWRVEIFYGFATLWPSTLATFFTLWPLDSMVFQWYSMGANHSSNDGMVAINYCFSLSLRIVDIICCCDDGEMRSSSQCWLWAKVPSAGGRSQLDHQPAITSWSPQLPWW